MSGEALWQLSATELARRLSDGAVRSRDVVDAHLARIREVDPAVRAFTRVYDEEARAEADARDAERDAGRSRGPLHGLPVSVKECFDIAGEATTLGISTRVDRKATRDAAMVTMLREAGAVILGRTNLSQTMLFAESRNPVYGQTANPFSLAHSPGGSSGGEAAAVAAGMSPLGVGTDIGGSIRSPAAVTGVVGLKPTLDRWPCAGMGTALPGQEAVRSQCGPLARHVDDIVLLMSSLSPARMSSLDGRVPPLPWSDPAAVPATSLRIGVYTSDGMLPVSRAVARAIDEAAAALRELGCTVVTFAPPDVPALLDDYLGALSADGGATLRAALAGDVADPSIAPLIALSRLPDAARHALSGAVDVAGQRRLARMLGAMGARPVSEYWRRIDGLRRYRARMLDAMDAAGVDVVLGPGYATPALPHGMSKNFTLASSPAILWNAVQFPAGVVPVTTVRSDEVRREGAADALERHAAKVDAQSEGLPVGVQLAGRPWREDHVLAAMRALESVVSVREGFPRTPRSPV